MPKMKRHKGIAKRMKVSAAGKVSYNRSNAGHLQSGKSADRRRRLRKRSVLGCKTIAAKMRRAMQEE